MIPIALMPGGGWEISGAVGIALGCIGMGAGLVLRKDTTGRIVLTPKIIERAVGAILAIGGIVLAAYMLSLVQ